jgi:hypothetical protein
MRKHNDKLLVALAALILGGTAFAQSPSLTQPNNSAGTVLDMPPRLHMPAPMSQMGDLPSQTDSAVQAFDKLDNDHRGYVTRSETDRLQLAIPFSEADRNNDGRLDTDEFQRAWNDAGIRGQ